MGDFNGDGRLDLAVANASGISVLLGHGDATFEPAQNYTAGSSGSVAVGDFNGDGRLDLVVGNAAAGSVNVLFGNGDGTFALGGDFTTAGPPAGVVVADLNADGIPDVAVGCSNGNVSVLLGKGDGTFGPSIDAQAGGSTLTIAAGDLDGDGHLDLVTTDWQGNQVNVLLGHGDGTLAAPLNYPAEQNPNSVAIADFNHDGTPDLAVGEPWAGTVSVYLGSGNGAFSPPVDYIAWGYPFGVAVGDFNRDGIPDLAVVAEAATITVLLGTGDGTFSTSCLFYTVGQHPTAVAVGQFTASGYQDLVTTNSSTNSVGVFRGNGDGTFLGNRVFMGNEYNYPTGAGPTSQALADLDGDARLDLVVSNLDGTVSVYLETPDAGLSDPVSYLAGSNLLSVGVGDFNLDGRADLAVADAAGSVDLLLGDGAGGFGAPVSVRLAVAFAPTALWVGDLNGDAKTDVVVVGSDTQGGQAAILLGNGQAAFSTEMSYHVEGAPTAVAVGDFNHDGLFDLAVTGANSSTVSILLGNGGGGFATAISFSTGADATSAAVGDFNEDGQPDLALAEPSTSSVVVLLGKGDGSFGTGTTYFLALAPRSIIVGDFDEDGHEDLATAGDAASVILGRGDGSFDININYVTGGNASSLTSGDLDRNGFPDLIVVHQPTNSVGVVLGLGCGQSGASSGGPTDAGSACNGTVADLDIDPSNCGACGVACTFDEVCLLGACARPVARFDFDEGSGTTSVDLADGGHDGTLGADAGWSSGVEGTALQLGSQSGGFEAPHFVELGIESTPYTVEAWIFPLVNGGVLFHTADVSSGGQNAFDWCQSLLGFDSSGYLSGQNFYDQGINSYYSATASNLLPLATWTHVAESWSPTNGLRVYIDGSLVASTAPADADQAVRGASHTNVLMLIGSARAGATYCWTGSIQMTPFLGSIDEAKVWAQELSPMQIASDAHY